jgi:cell wall-associated NlpC family hydrolase
MPSRYVLGGAVLLTALLALCAALLLGGSHHAATSSRRTHRGVQAATTGGTHHSGAGRAVEVRDPEESKSFPAPASVHHSAAGKPTVVAEEVLAPGAASNAEVQQELDRVHAVEHAAQKQETATATTVPGGDSIGGNGQIPIPQDVPEVVQRVIAGANAIADFPYVFGGGHASFVSNSYDCSGSVSYALAAGGLLSAPETSGALESWGAPGPGKWITVYANAGHTYMYVNTGGRWMRYDTVGRSGTYASRWQPDIRSNAGFVARHWPGL